MAVRIGSGAAVLTVDADPLEVVLAAKAVGRAGGAAKAFEESGIAVHLFGGSVTAVAWC